MKKRFIDEQIIFAELRWLRVLGEYGTVTERMPDQEDRGYGRYFCVPRRSLSEVISHRSREGLERFKWAAVRCLHEALHVVSSRVPSISQKRVIDHVPIFTSVGKILRFAKLARAPQRTCWMNPDQRTTLANVKRIVLRSVRSRRYRF